MAQRHRTRPQRDSIAYAIGFMIFIAFIASFWQVIIACLVGVFIVYLIWRFREEIARGIAWLFQEIFRFLSWTWQQIVILYKKYHERRKKHIQNTGTLTYHDDRENKIN